MPADKVKAKAKEEEVVEEEQTVDEEAPDESTASQEGTEGATEGDQAESEETGVEPDAAALQAQLEAKDAEIATLKAKQVPAAEPVKTGDGTIKDLNTQSFFKTTLPMFKQTFEDNNATPTQKAAAVYDMTNKLVGAVLTDQIQPIQTTLATALVETTNEVEILTLKLDDPGFKAAEKDVRAELLKADWSARSKPGAVKEIFYKIRGRSGNGATRPAASATQTPQVRQALKDVSSGGGAASSRGASAGLTPAQEADRQGMSAEAGQEMPSKIYFTKLKARQDKIKAENEGKPAGERRRVPQTLSEF